MNRHLRYAAVLAAACSICPAFAAGRADLVRQDLERGRPHVAAELLVQFTPGAGPGQRQAALRRGGAQALERVAESSHRGGELQRVRVSGRTLESAMRELEADAAVEFAEPNWIYRHAAVSNDPLFTGGSLWGMYGDTTTPKNAYGSQAAKAWAAGHTCGPHVYVGIIDEGVMVAHEDLAANAWLNPFDPPDGRDNDGNGYVDDTRGWDFANNDSSVFDGTIDDHGTHVAGTIAAAGGNGKGVAGVCWSAKFISAKFLGRSGGTTANAIKAVDYLTGLKTRHGLNLVATNNSWGGGGYSQALRDAIERSNQAGILFIAAAGNESNNNDATASYPASYDNANVIAVAAITSTGALASYSNYGASRVDLGAPGSGISSTVPAKSGKTIASGYAAYSGTSMATPHVTGAALLYAASQPGASHLQIRSAILSSVTPTPSLAGKCATGGRLNAGGF